MSIAANSLEARDIASLIHPYCDLAQHEEEGPLVIARGDGIYVYDTADKPYIDTISGLWCASLGFSEPALAEAAYEQLKRLPYYHTFHGKSTPPVIDLAERLTRISPVPEPRIFFANSGSEINDTVIKLIWQYNNVVGRPEKKKIVARRRSYHGGTIATSSLTGLPINHADFDLPIDRFVHTTCPDYYRAGLPGESEEAFSGRCAAELEALLEHEGPETVAAFFADPVMCTGGVIVPPATYFEQIQAVLRRHDILFVVDEVICGFGRTGDRFACETFDLRPDVVTVAKALSAAYQPISAAMLSRPIWEALREASHRHGTFAHGFTYSGHPVPAAVAVRTLELMEERDILGHVRSVVPRFRERLEAFREHPLVGDVRGVGLLGAVELVADQGTKRPFDPELGVGVHCTARNLELGLIVRPLGDTFPFCPPLIITASQIDDMFDRFGRALDDTAAMVADHASST